MIKKMAKVAIVTLNWNGKEYLERFLPSVVECSNQSNTEIYVADNHSSDDSIDFMKKNYPEIRIISFDHNYGFAQGYVKALAQIKSEYFVLLNSDVEVTKKWLSIIELMDKDMSIAAVMPKIMSYNNKDYFEYAGAAGGFIDKFGYPFCRGRILNVIEKDNGQYNDLTEVFWASGACMFLRSKAYFEAGGLDNGSHAERALSRPVPVEGHVEESGGPVDRLDCCSGENLDPIMGGDLFDPPRNAVILELPVRRLAGN